MEFYGSIASVSGSITASLFTGSFKGDGGGLYNLPASGVTGLNLSQIASGNATASISSTGFTVNKSTQIQGDLSVTGSIIATNYIVSSSVTYMTTSFASGSSMFGNDSNDVHQFTGSVQITGSITLNGQAIGTGKLDETTFQSYTSSISSSIGSLSSSIALTDVSQSNRLTTIEGNYATTGSNLFKGNQTISGSIIPAVSGSYDLGDLNHPFRHLYLSSASLYIDGTKVLGSTTQELQITTDNGQSFKILESGTDSITLQSSDGDIQLKASGGGNVLLDPTTGLIDLRGTIQVQDGNKFRSSGGTQMVFGDNVDITGSLRLTGTIQGVDLLNFSSSVSASINSLLGGNTSLSSSIATTTSGLSSSIGSLSSSVATTTSGLSSSIGSLSSSVATTTSGLSSSIGSLSSSIATTTIGTKNRVDSIETTTGSLNTFSSSINTTIKSKLDSESVISGSAQVIITGTTGYSTFSSSVSTSIGALSSSVATTTSGLSSSIGSLSSSVATTTSGLSSSIGSLSSSVATTTIGISTIVTNLSSSVATTTSGLSSSIGSLSSSVATTTSGLSSSIGSLSSSVATTTLGTKNRVDSIETSTGSLNTFTSSASGRLTSLETASGSIRTDFNTYTGSNNTTNTTQDGRLTSIEGITGSISSLNTYTGSNNTVIGTLQTSTSSLNSYTSSNTTNINAIHTSTGSFKSFTSSFDTAFGMSGADVTVKGNLTVSGTQTTVNSTTVAIGDNIIQLNGTGATNAGLVVRDATAPNTVSGSFLWDSTNDKWIAGALGSEDDVVLKTATQTLTNKTINASQLVDASVTNAKLQYSSLSIAGTSVSLNGSISVATILSGTGTVSGSSQISHDSTTGYVANRHIDHTAVSISAGNGLSGGGDISTTRTISLDTTSATFTSGVKSKMNVDGVVSGSAQISFNGITDKPTLVSGSSQITYGSLSGIPTGIVSGSSQITFGSISSIPSGLVSGSSQIDLTATTNYASGILTRLNAVGVFSGSAQVTGIGNAQLTNSSFNIGTTSISLGRASASQTLTGVSIDGNAATVTNGVYTNVSNTITGGRLIVGYSEASEPFVNGHFYNTNTTASQQYGGILLSGINQAHLRFQVGTNTWSASGAKQWQIRVGNGTGADEFGIYSWTKGSNTMTISSNGDTVVSGNLSATNFSGTHSGTSSGTNTGDQTSVSGNAGTVTNGVYTTGAQTISGIKTFSGTGAPFMKWSNTTSTDYLLTGMYDDAGSQCVWIGLGGRTQTFTSYAAYSQNGLSINQDGPTGILNIANRGTQKRINLNTGTEGAASFTTLRIDNQTVSILPDTTGGILNVNGNMVFGNQGSKITFGDSTSANPIMIGEGLVDTYGTDSDFISLYARSSFRIFTTATNERARFDANGMNINGTILPGANNSYNLGSATYGWANVYTNDLHLSNMNKPEGNDIDGTNGNWTIQEGAEQLYIINNNNGKKFKIDLTEII